VVKDSLAPRFVRACVLVGLVCASCLPAGAVQLDAVWTDGDGNWNVAGNWSTDNYPNNGEDNTYNVTVGAGTVAVTGPYVIDALTVDAAAVLDFAQGRTLTLNADSTVDGVLQFHDEWQTPFAAVYAGDSLTLGGAGTLLFITNQAGNKLDSAAAENVLTLGPDLTVATNGASTAGSIAANAVMQGLVDANGGTVYLSGYDKTNVGTVQSRNGGDVFVRPGVTVYNAGGEFSAGAGSTITFDDGSSLIGGTISGAGSVVLPYTTYVAFQDVTLDGVQVDLDRNMAVTIVDTMVNNGTIDLHRNNYSGGYAAVRLNANASLLGNGQCVFSTNRTDNVIGPDLTDPDHATYVLTLGAEQTIRTSGPSTSGTVSATMDNYGTIDADGGNIVLSQNAKTNYGLFQASNGGTLDVEGAALTNNGTIAAVNGGTVNIPSSGTYESTIANYAGGTLTGGTWLVQAGGVATTLDIGDRPVATNAATVTLSGADSAFAAFDGVSDNAAGGTINLLDGRQFTTAAGLTNAGTIRVGAGSELAIGSDGYTQTAGSLIVDGAFDSADPVGINGGTVSGNGAFTGDGAVTFAGTVSPGASVGQLTFANLSIVGGACYHLDVGPSGSDLVEITGPGNAFQLDPTGFYTVALSLLDYDGVIGEHVMFHWAGDDPVTQREFADINWCKVSDPDVVWGIEYRMDDNQIVAVITEVPEPGTLALLAAAALPLLRRRRS
jgi:MYXO-CTERM domain-containing protein